jgi:hypothetical protein
LIERPDDTCTVFLMAEGNRSRRGYENDEIKELFQGPQYAGRPPSMTYPGARRIRADEGVTVQMSYLDLGETNALIAENVPHLAVWIPAPMTRDTLIQPQGAGT